MRLFQQLGVHMMHMTYNRRNTLGEWLWRTARTAVSAIRPRRDRRMNKLGVIVDVAHSGWRTSF